MSPVHVSEAGTIVAVFAHRFVLERPDGSRLLADLGPEGIRIYRLIEGAELSVEGEVRPSELKVKVVNPKNGEPILIPHGKGGTSAETPDADAAFAAVRSAGLTPLGAARRKPKHSEVLARRDEVLLELHVDVDGTIRKERPADPAKWADAIAAASTPVS